ncbi:MAG: hypothetical protein MZV70_61045 [Desulfobacterales bacterium]|nr:hypothetical protein [Desulfobacterales bacterium]
MGVAAVDDQIARVAGAAGAGSMNSSTGLPAFTISITRRGRFSQRDHLLQRVGADHTACPWPARS